jgi:hypothetical protein
MCSAGPREALIDREEGTVFNRSELCSGSIGDGNGTVIAFVVSNGLFDNAGVAKKNDEAGNLLPCSD